MKGFNNVSILFFLVLFVRYEYPYIWFGYVSFPEPVKYDIFCFLVGVAPEFERICGLFVAPSCLWVGEWPQSSLFVCFFVE